MPRGRTHAYCSAKVFGGSSSQLSMPLVRVQSVPHMLFPIAAGLGAALLTQTAVPAQSMDISPNGSRPATMAPADHFTGNVTLEPLSAPKSTLPTSVGLVTFAPGAHSERKPSVSPC
jgi:hypothetical protein